MPQIFSTQIITEAGLALAAQATSTNMIQFVDALSCATVPDDPREISQYTGRVGTIDAASATDNVARIVVAFMNALDDNPQAMKAIALTGKLASEPDSAAVIVAYAYDSASSIVLPRASAPDQVMRFAFNLAFNAGETVSVFQTGDATVEDLLDLVSCHKPGQPTVGADQDVYGKKYFKNTAYFGGGQISIAADVSGGQYNLALTGMKPELDGVQPRFVVGYSLTRDRNEITFQGTKTWSFYKEDFSPISEGCTIGYGTDNPPKINATIITAMDVGKTTNPVRAVFANNVYTASTGGFHGSLYGCIPRPSYDSTTPKITIPVGGIALVFVYYDWAYKLHCGESFQCGPLTSHYTSIREAAYVEDSPSSHWEPGELVETENSSTYYTWKLLSCLDSESGSGTDSYGMALVMRID